MTNSREHHKPLSSNPTGCGRRKMCDARARSPLTHQMRYNNWRETMTPPPLADPKVHEPVTFGPDSAAIRLNSREKVRSAAVHAGLPPAEVLRRLSAEWLGR